MPKELYTRLPGIQYKIVIYTAAVYHAKRVIYTAAVHPVKSIVYTAAVYHAKRFIYSAAVRLVRHVNMFSRDETYYRFV